MKRIGNLYGKICSFENLYLAACRARRGKRYRPDVAAFHHDLEKELLRLREELRRESYQPGSYRAFRIRDPKPRLISAAAYRDRVVHHAVCQVIEPIFDRAFIFDSYANRRGKGTHKALDRCTSFSRRFPYVLKCDLEKYFPSIDHEILKARLARKLKCRDTLWLLGEIIDNSNPQEDIIRHFPCDTLLTPLERRRGLPIGNLTSQFFANVYLDGFDHVVQQDLRCPAYVRFSDDFLIFKESKEELREMRQTLQKYLNGLRLCLHPRKCQVAPTRAGVDFLGWLVFPDHRLIRRTTGVRFQRRLRSLQDEYAQGLISLTMVRSSLMSWLGHLKHGDTWGFKKKLLSRVSFSPATPSLIRAVVDEPLAHP